jgi:hypothetical protein
MLSVRVFLSRQVAIRQKNLVLTLFYLITLGKLWFIKSVVTRQWLQELKVRTTQTTTNINSKTVYSFRPSKKR